MLAPWGPSSISAVAELVFLLDTIVTSFFGFCGLDPLLPPRRHKHKSGGGGIVYCYMVILILTVRGPARPTTAAHVQLRTHTKGGGGEAWFIARIKLR